VPILFGFLDPLAPFFFYLKNIKNVYFLSFLLKTLKKSKFFSLIGFFDRTTYVGCGEGVGQFMCGFFRQKPGICTPKKQKGLSKGTGERASQRRPINGLKRILIPTLGFNRTRKEEGQVCRHTRDALMQS
jgi:hypothetical protein